MEEITDEMRLEIARQAKEAAIQSRDRLEEKQVTEEVPKMNLSPEEIQKIIKENQERALLNKNKIENNQISQTGIAEKPTPDELLRRNKELMEDMYVDIKKYKSLSQLDASKQPQGRGKYEDKVLRQISNKRNIGQNLGSIYDK